MRTRIIPCTECRKNRRKCKRVDLSSKCLRCQRLGKECVEAPVLATMKVKGTQPNSSQDAEALLEQIEQLELAIQHTEDEMRTLSKQPSQLVTRQRSPLPLDSLPESALQHLFYQWKVRIENGIFSIETGIKSVSDLIPLQSPLSQYLSPLSYRYDDYDDDELFRYNNSIYSNSNSSNSSSGNMSSNSSVSSQVDTVDYLPSPCGRNSPNDITREANIVFSFVWEDENQSPFFTTRTFSRMIEVKSIKDPDQILLPWRLLIDPKSVILSLIDIFFSCDVVYSSIVHEPTFRKKLPYVQDLLSHPLALAICCFVCANPCNHDMYTLQEKRNMADFFYAKARDALIEQFDDYDKRLENVNAVCLLTPYQHHTLRFLDCQRLVDLGYNICLDLRREYKDPVFTQNSKKVIQDELLTEDITQALLSRNIYLINMFRRYIAFITDEALNEGSFKSPRWLYLADESEELKRYVCTQDWLIMLSEHPFFIQFLKQIHQVHIGKICTLSFDAISRAKQVIEDWPKTIPEELQLCDDYFDVDMCKKAIDATSDPHVLMSFCDFHSFQINIHAALLQPKFISAENIQFAECVLDLSLKRSFQGCQLLIYAFKRLFRDSLSKNSCNYSVRASNFLLCTFDVLVLLSLSQNETITQEAKRMTRVCYDEIKNLPYIKDMQVPEECPISTAQIAEQLKNKRFDVSGFEKYTHPWFAMIFQVVQTFVDPCV